jgi:hypothetical protein
MRSRGTAVARTLINTMTKLKTLDVAALSTVSGGQQAASWTTNTWANGAWAGAKAGAQAAWTGSWAGQSWK